MAHPPASLTAALARDIPPYIRDRGDRYVRGDRVAGVEWTDARIACSVRGSDTYLVGLSREPGAIVVSCTCPYFLDRGPCKHVWAAAVAIDQDPRWDGSWLEGDPPIDFDSGIGDRFAPGTGGAPALLPDLPPSRGARVTGRPPAGVPAHAPRKKPDPVTAAAQAAVNRLAELRQQLTASSGLAGGVPRQARPIPPPDAQLIFILDADATKATGMLMVHTATRKREP